MSAGLCKRQKVRVAVLYRVVQDWRLPIFERLSQFDRFEVKLFYGCDFPGTKVVSARKPFRLPSKKMWSIPIKVSTRNQLACVPFSPFLFFYLLRYNPDVIVCEGPSNLINNISAYIYAKLFRKRYVQWGLGEIRRRRPSRIRLVLQRLISTMERNSDAIFVYSSTGSEYYRRVGVSEDRIFVGVNVVDTEERLAQIANLSREALYAATHAHSEFVVLFVGALTPEKKVDVLVRAYARLEAQHGNRVRLIVVGDGPSRSMLEDLARELKLEHIDFTGRVLDAVGRYFAAADVFVMPGLGGLAVSDAMVHGLPVIAGIGDGCEKDLLAHRGGIQDDDLDETRLFGYLEELLNDPTRLNAMKRQAARTIKETYNINTYMNTLVDCLERALR